MSYFKYILKGFKNNISRLLAIIAIITLGIGFLVGLSTSSTDIRTSVNTMYNETNVMDLNLKSTIGFSKDTVDKLNDRSDMDAIGVFQLEAKESFLNTSKIKSRLISSDIENDNINKLTLVEGRMPEGEGECVVLKDMDTYHKAKIGDTIRVKDSKMDIDKTYNVVGIVKSPLYFAKDKEYNLTGTNRLDLLFFVDSNYYDFDLITDIYIKTSINKDRFSGGYFDDVKKVEATIEDMEDEIISARREDIKSDIKNEIIDTKLDEIKDIVDKEIKKEIRVEILKEENYQKLVTETNDAIKVEIRETILKPENYDKLKNEANAVIKDTIREEILKPQNYDKLKEETNIVIKAEIKKEILKPANYDKLKNEANEAIKAEIKANVLKPENFNTIEQEVHSQTVEAAKLAIENDPEQKKNLEAAVKDAAIKNLVANYETMPEVVPYLDTINALVATALSNQANSDLIASGIASPTEEQKQAYIDSMPLEKKEEIKNNTLYPLGSTGWDSNIIFTPEIKAAAYEEGLNQAAEGVYLAKKDELLETAVNAAVKQAYEGMTQEDFNKAYDTALNEAVAKGFSEMSENELQDAYNTALNEAVAQGFDEMSEADLNKAYSKALDEAVKQGYEDMTPEDFKKAYDKALDEAVIKGFDEMALEDKNEAYDTAINEAVDKAYDEFINKDNSETKLNSYNTELDSENSTSGEKLYVLNLKTNQSYISVKENSNKIDKIAVIFPVFFYFIAALVALTTITRLVNEERSIIGLFKSLGFSKFKILSKYLLFALVCSIVGSALGNLAGVYALPYVVYGAYKTILDLPPMVYTVEAMINGISVAMMIITIMGVATYVTLQSLRERPAQLLQPKAPKPGKRLLLERWKGLWKRIKFKYKNTLRNIFRYKKNLAMMMVGVGGCVALLLTAFGIRDAFDTLASVQYDKIVTYDMRVSVDEGSLLPSDILNSMDSYTYVNEEAVYIDGDDDYLINRVKTNSDISSYFSFKDGSKKVEFNSGDVVIDEQIAKAFKLKVGSSFSFDDSDKEYTVSGIFDNHIDNYVFIYDDTIDEASLNTYLLNFKDGTDEDKLLEDLELSNVLGVESISQKRKSFDTMLSSVVLILVVVIICSGALAVIVIYNLTNININERFKEIATLKVLGYQNREVYGYIYREIFVLTVFGILLGFLVGPFLYKFVMLNLNEPGLMFPTSVHPLNYLYSFLFTLLFAFIVDLILIRKMKNIKMVESLKCVD